MRQTFERILAGILFLEKWIIVICFFVMTSLLLVDTLGREFFGQGFFGANIYATFALIIAAMAGFGVATAAGAHLRPNFLDALVSGQAEKTVTRIGQFIAAAIAVAVALAAIQFVAVTIEFNEANTVVGWPLWPIQIALPIGFTVAALRHFIYGVWPDLIPLAEVGAE